MPHEENKHKPLKEEISEETSEICNQGFGGNREAKLILDFLDHWKSY